MQLYKLTMKPFPLEPNGVLILVLLTVGPLCSQTQWPDPQALNVSLKSTYSVINWQNPPVGSLPYWIRDSTWTNTT